MDHRGARNHGARGVGDRSSQRGERCLRPGHAAKANEQKQECERLTEGAHAYYLQRNRTIPLAPALVWRDSFLLAEARMHFRSYKSAEFLFREGRTIRLLINKRGLVQEIKRECYVCGEMVTSWMRRVRQYCEERILVGSMQSDRAALRLLVNRRHQYPRALPGWATSWLVRPFGPRLNRDSCRKPFGRPIEDG